ncbi:MAG TPA: hypothetical protein VK999_05960 [Methylotenera sp.]|nr:hypothetical protein [Methylotenera sp.]
MLKGNLNKIVLCATADNLLAGLWYAGKLQGCQRFVNDESGLAAFAEFLQQYPTTPVFMIVDAVEEDYRLESLPHTSGAAKRELITRKLNQFYRGLYYRTAHFVSRDKDKRKDDNYLFAALNNDEFIEGWIGVIQQVDAQLVGIYLLPMLSKLLIKQFKLTAPNILLCEQLSSGLRQTYFDNGRLSMSRLVPNMPDDSSKLAYFYLVETEKTRLYLMSKRFISLETRMNLVLVSANGSTQHISQAISQEQGLDCLDVNTSEMAKSLGLPLDLVLQKPELLHMQLLANGNLVDNLAPEKLTKNFQFRKIRQAIKIGTVAVGVLGALASAWVLVQGISHQTAYDQAVQDTMVQEFRYQEVAKSYPATPISAADLQIAVELHKKITAYPKSPRRMMQVLSAALEQSNQAALENIQLDRLRWLLTNDGNVKDNDKSMPVTVSSAANNTQTDVNLTLPADTSALHEIGFITAEINDFSGDYRAALSTVNRYVANLKADARVGYVEVLQEPVNVSSFADLQGSTADEQSAQKSPAYFKLKVILKPLDQVQANTSGVIQP